MTLPDWVLNGTTYKDLGTVGDFSMMWNFNTREKARLTGGLFSKFLPSLLSWPFCRGAADERGLARLQLATLETRKGLEPKCVPSQPRPQGAFPWLSPKPGKSALGTRLVPSLGSLLWARRWAKMDLTIRQRRRPWKRRRKIDFASFHFFSRLFQGAQLLKRREFSLKLKRRDRARILTEMVEFIALPFPSPSRLKIWSFHVVVVQGRARNLQKSFMHVQSCCFAH